MADVERVDLPGVGFRADMECASGVKVGVLVHRSGRRDLLLYGRDDPDTPIAAALLDVDEARTLSELLGGPHVEEGSAQALQLPGLVIDWVTIPSRSPLAGQTLKDAAIHTRTGVSVVALVRAHETIAAPGAQDVLSPGDTAVIVGDEAGVERFHALLDGS
jgi:TrkA domain protein